MKYTDDQLIRRVEINAEGFEGWKAGVYDVWVRSTADAMDAFDDKVYTFECKKDGTRPVFVMVGTGTTNAGSYGLKNFRDYNREGCAVLKSDVIVYGSHVYGTHKNYAAYRQAKPFPYFRDGDGDGKAEETGAQKSEIIFANCHRASPNGVSTRIYNWSVACLVRNNINQWAGWLAFLK